MNTKFKVGDWCFSNFELCQVKQMDGNRVTSVTTGVIERSGNDLSYSCFPLEMKIKRISESVEFWHKKLHSIKTVNLNYPDIVRSLESRWVEMCENKDNDKAVSELYDGLQSFCREIIEKAESMKYQSVDGISIIRR